MKGDRMPLWMLERALDALVQLVRQEYPQHLSLEEIAQTWGERLSPEQIEALGYVEKCLSASSTSLER